MKKLTLWLHNIEYEIKFSLALCFIIGMCVAMGIVIGSVFLTGIWID